MAQKSFEKNSGHTHGEDESSTSRQLFVSLNQTGGDFLSTKGENRKWQNKRVHFSLSSLSFICPSAKEEWCATVFLLCRLTQPLTHTYTPSQTSSAALCLDHTVAASVRSDEWHPHFNYCPSSVLLAVFEAASHMFLIFKPASWTKSSEVSMLVTGRQRRCRKTSVKMPKTELYFLVLQERTYGRGQMRTAKRNVSSRSSLIT